MAPISYGWDMKSIAKISAKMAEKQPFFDFFDFLRNFPYDSSKNFYSHFTPHLESYMCNGIKIVWLGCDVRNIAKISLKWPKNSLFSQKLSIRLEQKFLQSFYATLESYMCNGIKIVLLGCDVRNIAKISLKWPKNSLFSQKLSIRFQRNFLQSFYTIIEYYMCSFNDFV